MVVSVLPDEYEATLNVGDEACMAKDATQGDLVIWLNRFDWCRDCSTDHKPSLLYFECLSPYAIGLRLESRVVNRLASGEVSFVCMYQ